MSEQAKCDDCQKVYDVAALDSPDDLWERIDAGGEVPAGQCPDPQCGALAYLIKPQSRIWVATTDTEYGLSIFGVFEDEGDLYKELAESIRNEWWDEINDEPDVPDKAPEDDRDCVEAYYEIRRDMDPMENVAIDYVPVRRKG